MKHLVPRGHNYECVTNAAIDFCDALRPHVESAQRTGVLPAELAALPQAQEIATEYAEVLAANKLPNAQSSHSANLRRALLALIGA